MVTTRSSTKHTAPSDPPKTAPAKKRTKVKARLHATVEDASDPEAPKPKPSKSPKTSKSPDVTSAPKDDTKAASNPHADSSPVLESGVIYFFLRGKVDVESPDDLSEVKRTHIILHPSGSDTYRLIAVPKKRLPASTRDRFLTILEEPNLSADDLKERFLRGRTYDTKTKGERTDPPAEAVGEGVYALTKAEKEGGAHLAYVLNVPEKLGEVQKEMGIAERGSWVVRLRNPETNAPPGAGVAEKPEYSEEILKEFRGLKWGTLMPKHLEYKNAEVLFIGEKNMPVDGEHKETGEVLEKLEDETEDSFGELKEKDVIFQKLDELRVDFDKLRTSWE